MQYREITGLWSARVPDGPDSDQYPDTVLLEGRVTFEPEYRVPLVYPGEHIVIEPMHAVIHEGVLYGETVVGDDVVRGPLFLPVTVDEAANQSWSWVAKFQGMRLGEYGEEVSLPNVRFQVPVGEDALDLSAVIPVSQSGGTITVRGPAGPGLTDILAENGQLTMLWDGGGSRTIDIPDAVPGPAGQRGPQGPAGTVELIGGSASITINDSVGRRVFIGDELVFGRTGLRDITGLIGADHKPPSQTGRILVSRFGSLVTLSFQDLILGGTSAWVSLMNLPPGFRPTTDTPDVVFTGNTELTTTKPASLIIRHFGGVSIEKTAGNRHRRTIAYATSNEWPTTLPGIPA